MKTDERKKIKADANSKVAEVLAQKDQAQMQAKLTELFNDVLIELAEAKSDKDKSVEDNTRLSEDLEVLKSERDELAKEKAELEAKAEELQKKLDDADKKITDLEGSIQSMKQEAALQARVTELEEAGLISGGKVGDKQRTRIKSMSDEEFAEYKSELLELKAAWSKKEEPAKETPAKNKKGKEVETETDEDADKVAAAALAELADLDLGETKITASQLLKLKKAAAAFNVMTAGITRADEFGEDDDVFGLDAKTVKDYESMWEDGE